MIELLIRQLQFARAEFQRVFIGLEPGEAHRRLLPSNSLSWTVGHLAWQEQRYWIWGPTGRTPIPELNELVAYGKPATIPDYAAMWDAWRSITSTADQFLNTLQESDLNVRYEIDGRPFFESIGTLLQRNIFHYWFHIGEVHGLRQQMGHVDLPNFVGQTDLIAFD